MVETEARGRACIYLAKLGERTPSGGYWVLDVDIQDARASSDNHRLPRSLSVHLFARETEVQIVGVERPN
jgi:hypothetical protein